MEMRFSHTIAIKDRNCKTESINTSVLLTNNSLFSRVMQVFEREI